MLHVCLDMLCFCLLKIIAVATLFSQLLILKHFKKKSSKNFENFLIFEQNPKSKKSQNFWKSRKSQKYFWKISIENRIENRKIKNFKISKFSIFNTIFNGKFSKIFLRFSRFSKILRFFDFGFCSKIKKFSTFFDDFF